MSNDWIPRYSYEVTGVNEGVIFDRLTREKTTIRNQVSELLGMMFHLHTKVLEVELAGAGQLIAEELESWSPNNNPITIVRARASAS